MTKIFILMFMFQATSHAAYWARTTDSRDVEYQKFLEDHQGLPYIEWVIARAKSANPNPPSLDPALEKSESDPAAALVLFHEALNEIKADVLGPSAWDMMVAIDNRVLELEIPEKSKRPFLNERNFLQSKKKGSSLTSGLFPRDLKLTLERLHRIPGLEEATLLLEGRPAETVDLEDPNANFYQWALVSNTFEPLIVNGSWKDLQMKLQTVQDLVPLIRGQCPHLSWNHNAGLEKSPVGIFQSSECGDDPELGARPNIYPSTHLGQSSEDARLFKAESSPWRWILPVGLVVAGGVAYAMKDKHLVVTFPSF